MNYKVIDEYMTNKIRAKDNFIRIMIETVIQSAVMQSAVTVPVSCATFLSIEFVEPVNKLLTAF